MEVAKNCTPREHMEICIENYTLLYLMKSTSSVYNDKYLIFEYDFAKDLIIVL